MTVEAVSASQQNGNINDPLSVGRALHVQNQSTFLTQAGGGAVSVVQLPGGQTVQVEGVIQASQQSVIQSPQMQTIQVGATAEPAGGDDPEVVIDTQKRREILSRQPSFSIILSELSSDTQAVPKTDEEMSEDDGAATGIAAVTTPTSLYQTLSGQYIAITQGGALQISGADMSSSGQPAATILQYAAQASDGSQQFYVPGSQVVVQASTGDMAGYQIRTPTSGLSQGVAMAASPGAVHSPQHVTEEATRKREVRLMKNREAARECRRKKKEYVKCLENRVAVLENQNKTLIEELKALKDIYCHKAE